MVTYPIFIGTILNCWLSLQFLLIDEVLEKSVNAVNLLDIIYKPMIKAYLFFPKFALASLSKINAFFKGSDTLVQQL